MKTYQKWQFLQPLPDRAIVNGSRTNQNARFAIEQNVTNTLYKSPITDDRLQARKLSKN